MLMGVNPKATLALLLAAALLAAPSMSSAQQAKAGVKSASATNSVPLRKGRVPPIEQYFARGEKSPGAARVMEAMLKMKKLDIAELERAAASAPES